MTCMTSGQTLSIFYVRSSPLILKADRNEAGEGGRKCEKRSEKTKYTLPILVG